MFEGFGNICVFSEGREHNHVRLGTHVQDLRNRGEAIEARHTDVEQHHLGPQAGHDIHRLSTVSRLGEDLDVRVGAEDCADPGTDERFVVDDDDPHS